MSLTLVKNNTELASCVSVLNNVNEFAIDLEFDKNYYRYGFNLCLMQIFADDHCFLIDPISDELDIENLFPVLESEEIQKIVFAFGEDLRLLHSLGCFPKNLYDISIATRLLNYPPASLTNLVAGVLGVDTGKSSQKSNWYKRPLTADQVNYAAQDVLHLIELKNIFCAEAEEKNISEWIAEENSLMDELDYAEEESNNFLKEKDKKGLTEHEWHVFKKLMIFRENVAESFNRPSFKVIKKDHLKDLARNARHLRDWNNKKGIYRSLKTQDFKSELLDIIKEGAKEASDLGFSKTEPAYKPLHKEKHSTRAAERAKIDRVKNHYFTPIKQKITEEYGKVTASFIFSNRFIAELTSNEEQRLEGYKKEIFVEYAGELKLNPKEIMDMLN